MLRACTGHLDAMARQPQHDLPIMMQTASGMWFESLLELHPFCYPSRKCRRNPFAIYMVILIADARATHATSRRIYLLILGASNALALTSVPMGDTTSTSVSINKTTDVSRHRVMIASEINKMCSSSSSSESRMRQSCNTGCFNNDVTKCADSVRSRHPQSLYCFYASL